MSLSPNPIQTYALRPFDSPRDQKRTKFRQMGTGILHARGKSATDCLKVHSKRKIPVNAFCVQGNTRGAGGGGTGRNKMLYLPSNSTESLL